MSQRPHVHLDGRWLLAAFLLLATAIYWPGLSGGWLFDDYPNIVDNHGVQPDDASIPSLVNVALSSPASEFKRPLASLSFAANYLLAGLDPYWMKLTNLVIHLLNGVLVFLLARRLLEPLPSSLSDTAHPPSPETMRQIDLTAALVAAGWLLLPINLTSVLYVVQRMESMANLFVLLGLLGYVTGRRRMLANPRSPAALLLCAGSIIFATAIGSLAKETAVMLPLYAAVIDGMLFGFRTEQKIDWRVIGLFLLVLVLPAVLGLAWLLPGLLQPAAWTTRDFTLYTRLLSESRIVIDYVGWTLWPTPAGLSFYHDDFVASTGLISPWTTLASLFALAGLLALLAWLRRHYPLVALGIALFLAGQLLTATILPLELVYEHRNYFASFGLLLAVVPALTAMTTPSAARARFRSLRRALLAVLLAWWGVQTTATAYAWGDNLRLAQMLAERAPASPRAQYELGRTYIIYSRNDPTSPYTRLAYAPLERAAALPGSSILPQQALIFMNARMNLPLQDQWWDSMIAKLRSRPTGVQDDSSLSVLAHCARDGQCDLPQERMLAAFDAAMTHPDPSPRLLATYAEYAWSVVGDRSQGQRLMEQTVNADPKEPAYRITLIRMLIALGHRDEAARQLKQLEQLDFGGRLGRSLHELQLQLSPG